MGLIVSLTEIPFKSGLLWFSALLPNVFFFSGCCLRLVPVSILHRSRSCSVWSGSCWVRSLSLLFRSDRDLACSKASFEVLSCRGIFFRLRRCWENYLILVLLAGILSC
ncbi:unnamed protein product [Arabidopsis halleri]